MFMALVLSVDDKSFFSLSQNPLISYDFKTNWVWRIPLGVVSIFRQFENHLVI
jgi:hypothetical protein